MAQRLVVEGERSTTRPRRRLQRLEDPAEGKSRIYTSRITNVHHKNHERPPQQCRSSPTTTISILTHRGLSKRQDASSGRGSNESRKDSKDAFRLSEKDLGPGEARERRRKGSGSRVRSSAPPASLPRLVGPPTDHPNVKYLLGPVVRGQRGRQPSHAAPRTDSFIPSSRTDGCASC